MTKNDAGPAFGHGDPTHGGYSGMTLRDWFAGMALQGLIASNETYATIPDEEKMAGGPGHAAYYSYRIADAMLKARQDD